jgi:hypothetical protein
VHARGLLLHVSLQSSGNVLSVDLGGISAILKVGCREEDCEQRIQAGATLATHHLVLADQLSIHRGMPWQAAPSPAHASLSSSPLRPCHNPDRDDILHHRYLQRQRIPTLQSALLASSSPELWAWLCVRRRGRRPMLLTPMSLGAFAFFGRMRPAWRQICSLPAAAQNSSLQPSTPGAP